MLIAIPDVLTADQVVARAAACSTPPSWVDGQVTAGRQSARAKDNLQLAESDPVARELGDLILGALQRSALFISAALPLRSSRRCSTATRAGSRSAATSTTRSARSPARRTASAPISRRRCSSPTRTSTTAASWWSRTPTASTASSCRPATWCSIRRPACTSAAGDARRARRLVLLDPEHGPRRRPAHAAVRPRHRDPARRDGHRPSVGGPAHRHLPQPHPPLGRRRYSRPSGPPRPPAAVAIAARRARGRSCGRARAALRSALRRRARAPRRRGGRAAARRWRGRASRGSAGSISWRRCRNVSTSRSSASVRPPPVHATPRGRLRHRHHRRGQRLLVHDDGAGGQIAEPLVARRHQHRDDADGVDAGQLIDHAQQVAQDGFVDPGRAAGDAQHAEADQPLARRLPVPERLEPGEVAVEQQERRR